MTLKSHNHHTKSASTSSIRHRIPQADMPKLTNLDQLSLHAASSQLVGTPYATDSTKFEYPFPGDGSSSSASASSSTYGTPAILTPPLSSGTTFPLISASTSSAQLTFPCLIQPGDSSSSSSSASSTSSFVSIHPKLKPSTNPPVPPSLVKKRPKWSVSIMGRRRSSYEGAGFPDGDGCLIESFLSDGVIVPHSRDEFSRNEH